MKIATALLAMILVSPAYAENFYIGVALGASHYADVKKQFQDEVADIEADGFIVTDSDLDDTDAPIAKLVLGYTITRHFAIETAYIDMGAVTVGATVTDGVDTVAVHETAYAKGFVISGVGIYPLPNRFALTGKIGLFMWDTKLRSRLVVLGCCSDAEETKASGTSRVIGIGGQYDFSSRGVIRIEIDRYFKVGDENKTIESDIDTLMVSVLVRL